jgi:molybdate transport system permease protein
MTPASPRGRDLGFRLAVGTTLALFACYLLALVVAQTSYVERDSLSLVLRDADLWSAVRLSLITATLATVLALLFAVPAAYGLSRFRFPGRGLVDALIDLPIILSPVAVGTAILMMLRTSPGQLLEQHMIQLVFTIPGIVLAQFTIVCSLAIRLLRSTFDELDPRYEDVARFLGCSRAQAFLRVTLPMSRGGILAAAILCWARALGEFGATVTVAGAMRGRTETLPSSIHRSLEMVDLSRTAVLMTLLLILALAVLVVLRVATARRADG